MNSFNIRFFKHTGYTASAYLHTLLRATATCKSIYALPTTLYGENHKMEHIFQDNGGGSIL
jgi:hypothetical protein